MVTEKATSYYTIDRFITLESQSEKRFFLTYFKKKLIMSVLVQDSNSFPIQELFMYKCPDHCKIGEKQPENKFKGFLMIKITIVEGMKMLQLS